MTTTGTIIPILGAQYFANPKDVAASLTEAEKEARTFDLLTKVPRMAYYSILTLMLIREQTCEEFCMPNLPLTTDDYLSDDVIQDMEQMPVTIGQVLHYGQTQCELPVQRATIQMLANWLRDEYTHSNCNTSVFRSFPKLNTAECLKKENGSEEKYLVSIDAIS